MTYLLPQHTGLPVRQADNHSICPEYIGASGVAFGILWKPVQEPTDIHVGSWSLTSWHPFPAPSFLLGSF